MQSKNTSFSLESGENVGAEVVDDSHSNRTGTLMTAVADITRALIGAGVLCLPWCIAQLGWIAGPVALLFCSLITCFTSLLLADSYRPPDPVTTSRKKYTYTDVVKANLGGLKIQLCAIARYGNLIGVTIGYAITASISMAAIKRSDCFHTHGRRVWFHTSNNPFMIIFGVIQIVLNQLPNFHEHWVLLIVFVVMSFAYPSIGIVLSIAKVTGGANVKTSLIGVLVENDVSSMDKMWNSFSALGGIAFAYSFSYGLIEIQDTLKPIPQQNKVMKKAIFIGISICTMFNMLLGLIGYAALGNDVPRNLFTGFEFFEPFWPVDLANVCIVVHLVGAYQVNCQPIFDLVENWSSKKWAESKFITGQVSIDQLSFCGINIPKFSFFKLVWRTAYVIVTLALTMIFPSFFSNFVGLLSAASFWILTIYFPIEVYIAQAKIRRFSFSWIWMQILNWVCFVLSLLAAAGQIQHLVKSFQTFKPFKYVP